MIVVSGDGDDFGFGDNENDDDVVLPCFPQRPNHIVDTSFKASNQHLARLILTMTMTMTMTINKLQQGK